MYNCHLIAAENQKYSQSNNQPNLHKLLNRADTNWTKQTFHILEEQNIGWAKTIKQTLSSLDLPTELSTIRTKRPNEWKALVDEKIEVKNRTRLVDDCHTTIDGQKVRKSKTSHIVDLISAETYIRKPSPEIHNLTKQETKTLIISRYRMLECGANFKNSRSVTCSTCNATDNEDHRLNHCIRFRATNNYDKSEKCNFDDVHSNDTDTLKKIIVSISKVWNTRNAHGSMLQ